jgi:hypothetical protein
MHVLAVINTNSAGGYTLNLDTKFHCRLFAYRSMQEFVRVLDRIRMWEEITKSEPDFPIVCVHRQRLRIIQSPRTNRAALQDELH